MTKRGVFDTIKTTQMAHNKIGVCALEKKLTTRKKKWIERTIANDRSYKLFLYNRFLIFLTLLLLQLAGYVAIWYLFVYQTKIGVLVQFAVGILSWIAVLRLINKVDKPSTRLGWVIVIIVAPVFGLPSYLLFGEGRPAKRLKQKLERAKQENALVMQQVYGKTPQIQPKTRRESLCRFLQDEADAPAFFDGSVEYYPSGDKMFAAMKEEIAKAENYILVEYFIIGYGKMWKELLALLLERAEAGAQIRIIYDDFGCMMTLPPKYDQYLEGLHENIRCVTFNNVVPVFALRMNNRDHRKILVVDGKVAFTGGVNIADEYIGEKRRFGFWKDTGLKITGDAVRSFIRTFFDTWNGIYPQKESLNAYLSPSFLKNAEQTTNGKTLIQPYADSPLDDIAVGEAVYGDMLYSAEKYAYIFTPYLILDDSMRSALCLAALRGVDVRIVTPAIPDKKTIYRLTRANYSVLMKAGVKIYEYTPGFIHAKSMLCDDECAVVGTINLDYRSLYLHFENAVYFQDEKAIGELKRDCEETFAVSKLCTVENTRRNLFGRIFDSLLRIFETLF